MTTWQNQCFRYHSEITTTFFSVLSFKHSITDGNNGAMCLSVFLNTSNTIT